jgi:kumamolisin
MNAATQLPEQRQYVSREAFASEVGADPDDVAKVEAFAQEHNLTVVEASLSKRSIRLAGTIGDLAAAFGVNLKRSRVGSRVVRTRTGGITVPAELHDIVVGVFGLDDRPTARPHYRLREEPAGKTRGKASPRAARGAQSPGGIKATSHNAADGSFTPPRTRQPWV